MSGRATFRTASPELPKVRPEVRKLVHPSQPKLVPRYRSAPPAYTAALFALSDETDRSFRRSAPGKRRQSAPPSGFHNRKSARKEISIGKRNMRKHKVGDHVLVKLSGGGIVEATIKAIVDTTKGVRLQVSSGDETARICSLADC